MYFTLSYFRSILLSLLFVILSVYFLTYIVKRFIYFYPLDSFYYLICIINSIDL